MILINKPKTTKIYTGEYHIIMIITIIIIITLGSVLFSSCQDRQEKEITTVITTDSTYFYNLYQYHHEERNGMKFGIWYKPHNNYATSSIFIINITKEQLEVQLLKEQLKK